jgi:hypothetical protein
MMTNKSYKINEHSHVHETTTTKEVGTKATRASTRNLSGLVLHARQRPHDATLGHSKEESAQHRSRH